MERKIEKLQKLAKGDKTAKQMLDDAENMLKYMNNGKSASTYPERDKESVRQLFNELRLMTAKRLYTALMLMNPNW